MAISYPVDVENTLWAIWDVALAAISARNKTWIRGDGMEIQPPDPNQVWLLQVAGPRPIYDGRLFHLVTNAESIDLDGNEITKSWSIVLNDTDDIKAEIVNEESIRFGRIAKLEQALTDVYIMTMGVAMVVKDNQAFHPKAAEMYPDMLARAAKLYKNRSRREELEASADAGTVQTSDLNEGWEDQ